MAGIYVNAGATPGNTVGGVTVPSTCDPLFYRNGCNPRFDPIATNNLISEVLRAVNAFGDTYNCESQDNLRNVILKARNLCGLPVIAPDLDDFIAGCYDGVSGLAPIQQLQSLFGICNLPDASSPDNDDTVGMCVDGFNSQVPVSALRDLILGQLPPQGNFTGWTQGGQFHAATTQGTVDVTPYDCFFVQPGNGTNFAGDIKYDEWDVANAKLSHYIASGEHYMSLRDIVGDYQFVRGDDGISWYWVQANGAWFYCGQRGNTIPYNPIQSGSTGTIRFYAGHKRQGRAQV